MMTGLPHSSQIQEWTSNLTGYEMKLSFWHVLSEGVGKIWGLCLFILEWKLNHSLTLGTFKTPILLSLQSFLFLPYSGAKIFRIHPKQMYRASTNSYHRIQKQHSIKAETIRPPFSCKNGSRWQSLYVYALPHIVDSEAVILEGSLKELLSEWSRDISQSAGLKWDSEQRVNTPVAEVPKWLLHASFIIPQKHHFLSLLSISDSQLSESPMAPSF